MPVGACAVSLALTALGYAAVPFKVSVAITLAAGAALGAYAWRHSGPPVVPSWPRVGWPAYVAVVLACVSLVPLFRAGFVTVEGMGQDAHLAVGTAQFLQKHYPTSIAPEEPVDRVPLVWRSKPPIYYSTGSGGHAQRPGGLRDALRPGGGPAGDGVPRASTSSRASCCGRHPGSRWPRWASSGLDRMVLHTVMHPYFNQTWGFFAIPFGLGAHLVVHPGAHARRRAPARPVPGDLRVRLPARAADRADPGGDHPVARAQAPEPEEAVPRQALAAVDGPARPAPAAADRRHLREGGQRGQGRRRPDLPAGLLGRRPARLVPGALVLRGRHAGVDGDRRAAGPLRPVAAGCARCPARWRAA